MRVLYFDDGDLSCISVDEIYFDSFLSEIVISDTVNNFSLRSVASGLSAIDGRALVHQAFMADNVDLTKFEMERF